MEAWVEWFSQRDRSKEIKPANEVAQDSHKYICSRASKLGTKAKTELSTVVFSGENPSSSPPRTENELLERLESMPLKQLSDHVKQELKATEVANSNLNLERSTGLRKAAAKFQDFAQTFDRFLRAYSGIVQVIQGADAQYGNIASATLSLLFVTVKLKAVAEKAIRSSMREVSERLPDLEVYRRIYPDPRLGEMLAEAYRDVILFARKVTVYCQGYGLTRYVYHVRKPEGFASMEKSMREDFSRIRIKCDVLLGEKIDRLAKDNQDLHEREDARIVLGLKQSLGLQEYQPNTIQTNLKEYRSLLRHHFDNDRRHQQMDLNIFTETERGKNWETPGSKLLLLSGRNATRVSSEHSWLSPVAADLAAKLIESRVAVAYQGCDRSSTLELTMSHLIFQLLERNPSLIRGASDFQEITSQLSQRSSGDAKINSLRAALLRIINLHDDPVYIILNRAELSKGSRAEHVETMLALVRDTTAELKVMMVQRSEFWDSHENEKEIHTYGLSPSQFQVVSLDQS